LDIKIFGHEDIPSWRLLPAVNRSWDQEETHMHACAHTRGDITLCWNDKGEQLRIYKLGQSATKEQKLHQDILQRILKEQGFAVSATKLVKLLDWIRDYCSWYPSQVHMIARCGQRWGRNCRQKRTCGLKSLTKLLLLGKQCIQL